jgi:hypothetical protein
MKKLTLSLILALLFSASANASLWDDVEGRWALNNSLSDDSGNGYTLTNNNSATFVADRDGNTNAAVQLNGVNQFLSVDGANLRGVPSEFSTSIWIKGDTAIVGAHKALLSMYGSTTNRKHLLFIHNTAEKLYQALYADTGTSIGAFGPSTTGLSTSWIHIVTTFSDANNRLRVYVNNSLEIETTSAIGTLNDDPTGDFCIGGDPSYAATSYFDGTVDDVAYWTKELTSTEVGQLYLLDGNLPAAPSLIYVTEVATDFAIFQRDYTTESAELTVSGTFVEETTTPTSIQARIMRDTTEVVGWTTIDSNPDTDADTFSGSITVPQGPSNAEAAADGYYTVQVRFGNDTSVTDETSNEFGVGEVWVTAGQSNIEQWLDTDLQTSTVTPNSNCYEFNTSWAAMTTSDTSSGGVQFANVLNDALDIPVGLIQCAIGSTPMLAANDIYTTGYWQNGTHYNNMVTKINGSIINGKIGGILWAQGERDARSDQVSDATIQAEYKAAFEEVIDDSRTDIDSNLIWIVSLLGGYSNTYADEVQYQKIRNAQILTIQGDANVYQGAVTTDLARQDDVHLTNAAFITQANRMAQTVLYLSGDVSYYHSPEITNYQKVDNSNFDIYIRHYGGTDFTPTSSISAFEVWDGASQETITAAARQSANVIRLTISGTVAGDPTIHHQWGKCDDVGTVVIDNSGLTLPLASYENISLDTTPPVTTITGPTSSTTYTAGWSLSGSTLTGSGDGDPVVVSGTATDNVGVVLVSWACPTANPASGTATYSAITENWTCNINLAEGSNTVTITSYDGAGYSHDDTLTVTYNRDMGYSLPSGFGVGDVCKFCYRVETRDAGSGVLYVGGCFPDTQLINQVGTFCMDLEIDSISTGPQFLFDMTNGWSGTINNNQVFIQRKQDN